MYFTRWIEMVHPVPGGPTFPEQKKRGHKKSQDVVAETDPVKVETVVPMMKKKTPLEKIVDVKAVQMSEESKKRESSPEKVRVIKRRRRRRSADAPLLPLLPKEISKAAKKLSAVAAAALISGDGPLDKEEEWCAVDSYDGGASASTSNAQGPYCTLTGGCTLHIAGEGAIQTRHVDFAAPLFQKESKYRECRKEILREELRRLTESFNDLRRCAEERGDSTKRPALAVKKRNKPEEVSQEVPEPVHDPTPQLPVEKRTPGMPIRKSPINKSPPTFTQAPAGPPKFHAGSAAHKVASKNSKTASSSSCSSSGNGNGNGNVSVLGGIARARAEEETSSECSDRDADRDGDMDRAEVSSREVVEEREGRERGRERQRARGKGRADNDNKETDDEAETEVRDMSYDRTINNDETDDDLGNLSFYGNEEETSISRGQGNSNSNSNADLETEDERDSEEYGDQGEVETEEERDEGGDEGDIEDEEESECEESEYGRDDSREMHSSLLEETGMEMAGQVDEEYSDENIIVEEESLDVAFKSRNYNDQIYRVGGLDAVNVEEDDDEEGEEDGEGEGEGAERYDEESVAACGFSTEDEDEDDNSNPESDGSGKF
jgi:hypothetical protein